MKKFKNYNGGEMSFGIEILLFLVVIFVIWILVGGAKKEPQGGLLMVPDPGQIIPAGEFGESNN